MNNPKQKPTHSAAPDNVPPNAIEFEMAVLGALMLQTGTMDRVVDFLNPDVFYRPCNGLVYEAIYALFVKQETIDSLTVVDQLRKMGRLEDAGGIPYICELTGRVASAANIEAHAYVLLKKYQRRETIKSARKLIEDSFDETTDEDQSMVEFDREILKLKQRTERSASIDLQTLNAKGVAELEKMAKSETERGAAMPFWRLADRFPYFSKGGYTLIGADTGVGKSALMQNILMAAGEGLVFSFEMTDVEIWQRALSMKTFINSRKLIAPERLTQSDWQKVNNGVSKLEYPNIHIYDDPFFTIEKIYAEAVKQFRKRYYPFIFIDYLQIVHKVDHRKPDFDHYESVSGWFKKIAQDLKTHVVSASQFRDLGGKRPTEDDLKGTRKLKADANNILLLYRCETDNQKDVLDFEDLKASAKIPITTRNDFLGDQKFAFDRIILTIAKGRSIGRGLDYPLYFHGATSQFVDPQDLTIDLIDQLEPPAKDKNKIENSDLELLNDDNLSPQNDFDPYAGSTPNPPLDF